MVHGRHLAGFLCPSDSAPLIVKDSRRLGSWLVSRAAADGLITIHDEQKELAHTSIFGARTSSSPQ